MRPDDEGRPAGTPEAAAAPEMAGVPEIREGMAVYGIFNGAGGEFASEGEVTAVREGGFDAYHGRIRYTRTYAAADIGRQVFLCLGEAERAADGAALSRYEAGREDFAEQNSRPFGKI